MPNKRVSLLSFLCVGLLMTGAAPRAARADDLSRGVLETLNFARTHPADYARELEQDAANDSADDLNETIDFLMRQSPLPPLRDDPRLDAAARAHSAEQEETGDVGHESVTGERLGQRLERHGVWAGMSAEDISYGYATPREVVEQLIVDAGVPGRGHRQNIFDRTLEAVGVGCGRHSAYGSMCVIDFAGAIVRR